MQEHGHVVVQRFRRVFQSAQCNRKRLRSGHFHGKTVVRQCLARILQLATAAGWRRACAADWTAGALGAPWNYPDLGSENPMSGMVKSETAVIGGAGNVGMGIVSALLDAGMPTVVIGRDAAKLDALRAQHGHSPLLDIVQGSVADDASAQRLATELA
ncbi:SDR family NAD(P)-dependent oxidoreductase, partial [Xanthomonas perforans]|nr:SDR family NAD(P)-dependent oxidoreductase [Xanthomonas perforans]